MTLIMLVTLLRLLWTIAVLLYLKMIAAILDNMAFEGGNTAQFLAKISSLCNNAEIINNPEEIRRRLLNTYSSNVFFRNEFAKRVTRTT